ncbi:MAG: peptidoglycan DD-metalloendopeptidase family protein [Butyricicoccaceae bacterium]
MRLCPTAWTSGARRSVTYTETILFGTVTRENDAEYQDYRETVRQGQTGEAVVTAEIQTLDGEENERTIVARTVLRSASDEIIEVRHKEYRYRHRQLRASGLGYTFTSAFKWRWGRLHSGVDLAVPEGTPVRASDNGKVILAENSGDGYGNYIILDHGNGFKTLYGHNSALCVSVGDIVSQGDLIAYSGNTGNSTGPHLHFEIHLDDEKVDPERFLSF